MDIKTAILEANKTNSGITRKSWEPGAVVIIPTNTSAGMIVFDLFSKDFNTKAKWQPEADDLIATDWIVTN